MAAVTVNSGLSAISRALDVPVDKWPELVIKRNWHSQVKLTSDCREVILFVREAELMWKELGYQSADDLIARGYGLEPDEIRLIVEWLEMNDPEEVVGLSEAKDKAAEMRRQKEEWSARIEAGESLRQIAAEAGVSHQTVANRVSNENSTNAESLTPKPPRQVKQYTITHYTKPETAARKIVEKFGEAWARQLSVAIGLATAGPGASA